MLDLKLIKQGEEYWTSQLVYGRKVGRCIYNTKPTKVIADRRRDGGWNFLTTKGKTLLVTGSIGTYDSLYETEEEAIEEYNKEAYKELDRLQCYYEAKEKLIRDKIIKKKEDI